MSRTHHHTEKYRRRLAKKINVPFCFFGIPPKRFRKMLNKIRRSREKQALREGKELPIDKKDASWHWF